MKTKTDLLTLIICLFTSVLFPQETRLNIIVSDSQDVFSGWLSELEQAIESEFDVDAKLFIYNDQESPNAFARDSYTGFYEVHLGKYLLTKSLFNKSGGLIMIAGIAAHEYGHVVQFDRGSDLQGKQRELLADFMAGYFMGKYFGKAARGRLSGGFFDIGDYALHHSNHHGTPTSRMAAALAGYRSQRLNFEEAYKRGVELILKNYP